MASLKNVYPALLDEFEIIAILIELCDVPLAPHVSLTFNQPMVPITSYAELEKLPVPARLTISFAYEGCCCLR